MSRLISMEDAIRAIEEEWDGCCSEYPATQIIYDTTEAIERLPIIQPEITHEQAVAYLQSTGWMQEHDRQMMLDGVHKLTTQPEPHWIPVTEDCECDLMDNEEVLVFQKDGTINGQIRHAMFYDFNGKKKFVTWEEGMTIYHVVAYMPLPEPYKGVTDDNR